ncbi:MAG TPA: ATP-binding protein, partial [Candidatus Paceibacterota bacterium]|nr:ATP-binding protein [Candidatus Paceibacterota bacterium]
ESITHSREIRAAFAEYDRQVILNNVIVGCMIGIVLMPLGTLLDHYVYPHDVVYFLRLRLLCSFLVAIFWLVVTTPFGRKHPRSLGVLLAFFPAFFMSWMIYATDGVSSPYYAGLNLVLLVVGFVLHWTVIESVVVVSVTMAMYIIACRLHGDISDVSSLVNNLYFLVLTGIIIVTGSYYHNKTRFREFAFRYELDKSRKALEASLQQLKENEMQLVQSEKLASLGRMSAGIIHEINNPLNFATTGLFTLRKKGRLLAPEQQADYTEVLTDVEDGLKRVQAIVSDLRMFTHPSTEQLDPVPVAEVVTPALRFLSNEWRDTVQIEQQFAEHQTILANKNRMIQVVMNLLQNSLDALKIKSFPPGEKPTIWIAGRVEDGQSILSVRDNGTGIDPKHVDKIFDPFFTTKDVGEGMGLGLSICYSIMQEYGGKISVKTELGKCCEFALEFPVKTNQAVN